MGQEPGVWGVRLYRLFIILIILFHIGKIWSQESDDSSSRVSSRDFEHEKPIKQSESSGKQPAPLPGVFADADTRISKGRTPWSSSYFNLTTSNVRYANQGDGQISAYNFIAVDYRQSSTTKLSLRPEFFWSGGGRDRYGEKKSEIKPGNIYLAYIDNELGLVPSPIGDLGIKSQFRLYIPFSEYSKQQKTITALEARLQFYRPLGNGWQFNYRFHPRYFVQSQTAYTVKYEDGGTSKAVTPMAELEHYVEMVKAFSRRWAFSQDLGFEHKISNSSAANNLGTRKSTKFYFRPGINFYESPISFKLGLSFVPIVQNGNEIPGFYNPDDSEYTFLAYVNF